MSDDDPLTTARRRTDLPRTDDVLAALAVVIREQRLAKGLSQGAIDGLSRNTVAVIERGENAPTVRTLLELADALDVNASDLLASAEAVVDDRATPIPMSATGA